MAPRTRPGESTTQPPRTLARACLLLPLPPSVNELAHTSTGRPLGNKSPCVLRWRKAADIDLWQQKPLPRFEGPYHLRISWAQAEYQDWDIDNRIKVLSDYLEHHGIIRNDRDCCLLMAYFAPDVEKGRCRVELWNASDAA